jgi:tripartite-type tricarboxylate transporter receptor subunit TctC
VAELGLKALESEVLYLVMAPAATPDAVLQPLARAITDALQRPEMQARMKGLDLFYEGQTGAAAAKRLADLHARYGELVRSTGMKAE